MVTLSGGLEQAVAHTTVEEHFWESLGQGFHLQNHLHHPQSPLTLTLKKG